MCSSEALSTGRPLWCRLHWRCALLPLPPPARQRRERRHPRAHLVAHFNSSQMMRFSSLASSPSSCNAPPLPAACFSCPAADRSLFKHICMHAGARRRREWRQGVPQCERSRTARSHNGLSSPAIARPAAGTVCPATRAMQRRTTLAAGSRAFGLLARAFSAAAEPAAAVDNGAGAAVAALRQRLSTGEGRRQRRQHEDTHALREVALPLPACCRHLSCAAPFRRS